MDWNRRVKLLLRAEMLRRDVSVAQLALLMGENEKGLANKISRGSFSAAWFAEALTKMGAKGFSLD